MRPPSGIWFSWSLLPWVLLCHLAAPARVWMSNPTPSPGVRNSGETGRNAGRAPQVRARSVIGRAHRASRFLDTRIIGPIESEKRMFQSTTILAVRHRDRAVMAGDGQVTFGPTVVKQSARKI